MVSIDQEIRYKKQEAAVVRRTESKNAEWHTQMGGSSFKYYTSPNLSVAPLNDPPIKDGMKDTFEKLFKILHHKPGSDFGSFTPPIRVLEKASFLSHSHHDKLRFRDTL